MEPTDSSRRRTLVSAGLWLIVALLCVPATVLIAVPLLGVTQAGTVGFQRAGGFTFFGLGVAFFAAVVWSARALRRRTGSSGSVIGAAGVGLVGGLAGGVLLLMGAAWGRPLRLGGRVLYPRLREGSDWTAGGRPSVDGLDADTRAALEALWLHDAQKEHASVPAFGRIAWMLAAIGAPAELLEGAHIAALEEIDHARRCFALAAGYGGRSHSVEAMPELLKGGLDLSGDPLVHLATESLSDGCLLEGFNADVAAECASLCREEATREVLTRIAREERSHANFSWKLLEWLRVRGGAPVRSALEKEAGKLAAIRRPTAVSAETLALVAKANPTLLRAHGRIPDDRWEDLWKQRVGATEARLARTLDEGSGLPLSAC